MRPNPERQALIDKLVERYRKRLEQQLPDEDATLEQIEDIVGQIGSDLMRDLQERLTNQRAKRPRQNRLACSCGGLARYRNQNVRVLVTRHGLLRWRRPYYHCPSCQKGFAPLDATLGLDRGETTPQVREWIAFLSAELGFVQAAEVLRRLCGIDVSAASVERIAVRVGSSLRATQQTESQLHHQDRLPDAKTPTPARLYVGADGVMTPLRDPWKKDGSAGSLLCRYGECKTGVVYQTFVDKQGRDSRVKTRAYIATLEGVETFELLLGLLAHRGGHHAAKEIVVLGDGAPWLWFMFARLFPGAVQILDFYHACDHLATVADAIYGKETQQSLQWQKARQAELKENRMSHVLKAIAAWKPKTKEHYALRRTEFSYFRNNAKRMQYKTYLQKGYHIGSGVVEAACKYVIAQRLDQAGMHWRAETAEAILTLRAAQLSTCPTNLKPHLAMAA